MLQIIIELQLNDFLMKCASFEFQDEDLGPICVRHSWQFGSPL